MLNENLYIIPLESCFITKGFSRSTIFDPQNKSIQFIPNSMSDFLEQYGKKQIKKIFKDFTAPEKEILLQYIDFLQNNGFIYLGQANELNLFSKYNFEWDYPTDISNAIIDISEESEVNYFEVIDKLDKVNCFHLQIRFYENFLSKDKLFFLLQYVEKKSFHTINLTINYKVVNEQEFFAKLIEEFPKLETITIYSSPFEKIISKTELFSILNFTKNRFDIKNSCGIVGMDFFSLTIEHYTESLRYNTCLNRKLCIGAEGNIKNCPNMKHNFGHIAEVNLSEVLNNPEFKKYWHIKKDDIDVCRDCEFRHICTDCRAFIKDPENIYSQPAKCGYNPYICKWQGQEGWISVEQWRSENKT